MTTTVTRVIPAVALLLTAWTPAQAAAARNWEESGQASWYGAGFEGRRTSSGSIFTAASLTAAHESLPLGTRLRVTTQDTGRSVVVTVTDRMPHSHSRIVDISRAAAKVIGLLSSGVTMVTLTEAKDAEPEEVAEAPDDADVSPPRRDRRHRHRGFQMASVHHVYYHARSEARVRH